MIREVILLLLILGFIKPLSAQKSLDLLERAYVNFDSEKYKKSIKLFEEYFEITEGSNDDYYFMAASLAKAGKKARALEYSEKACVGIETLGIMLADSHFKSIHSQLNVKYQQLKGFYDLYSNNRKNELNIIDSLYQQLELKRVTGFDLYEISEKFFYEHDTIKALYYYKEALENGNLNLMYSRKIFGALNTYERECPEYFNTLFPYIESVKQWTGLYQYYTYTSKYDSLALAVERLIQKVPEVFLTQEMIYNAACGFSLSGDYEKAGLYLIKALDKGFSDLEHLFQDEDLFPLFHSLEGQNTLKYIISKYYKKSFVGADDFFVCTSSEYSKSKRLVYDYLKSKDFNAKIPLAFEIFSNETNAISMPFFGEYEDLLKTDFEYVLSMDSNNYITVAPPQKNNKRIILYKKTKNSFYVDYATNCYNFPSENEPFICKVRQGDIALSKIHEIREKYLTPLRKDAFSVRLLTGIDSDYEAFVLAIESGTEHVFHSLVTLVKEFRPLELKRILKYIDYSTDHTAVFDIAVEILNDTSYYNSLSEREKHYFQDMIYGLYGLLPFKNLVGENKDLLPNYDHKWQSNPDYVSKLKDLINSWWELYKSENPFKLPNIIYDELPETIETEDTLGCFFIEDSTQSPVFYDPFEKTIQMRDSTYNFASNNFIKVGKIENESYIFTPSHDTHPDELLILSDVKESDLKRLQTIADSLNLKSSEWINTKGDELHIVYDRFYASKAFNDLVYIWYSNDSVFIDRLARIKDFEIAKNVLIAERTRKCFGGNNEYVETPYYLNSLQAIEIGDHLYVICNSKTSKKPYCKNNKYNHNTCLLKLDKDLRIINEINIPQVYYSSSNLDVQIITTSKKIYAFVCSSEKAYYQVYDLELKAVSELIEVSAVDIWQGLINNQPHFSIMALSDKVYMVYSSVEHDEKFLKIELLTDRKEKNKVSYLLKNRGVILNGVLIKENEMLKYIYTERFNNKYYINKLPIGTEILNQME